MPHLPQPTVPLGMHGLAWYRMMAKEDRAQSFNRAEWHLLAETAHMVELAAATDNVRLYTEIRYRLRALRLIETDASDQPTAAAVNRFNSLRAGRAGLRDPRTA